MYLKIHLWPDLIQLNFRIYEIFGTQMKHLSYAPIVQKSYSDNEYYINDFFTISLNFGRDRFEHIS